MRYAGRGPSCCAAPRTPAAPTCRRSASPTASALYEHIARLGAGAWNRGGQLALVVGATYPAEIARVRELAPTLPLLIPGIGAQGGDAEATVRAGWRPDAPIIVSSSRAVLYASHGPDCGRAARAAAPRPRRALLQRARG